jgi:multiple sugar transport system permease protein
MTDSAEKNAVIKRVLTHVILLIVAFIMIVPFAWMILTALKTNQEAISVDPFYIFPANGWH